MVSTMTNTPTPADDSELKERIKDLLFYKPYPLDAIMQAITAHIKAVEVAARLDECNRVMRMSGNSFVGNGEHTIHWQTRNRINSLQATNNQP